VGLLVLQRICNDVSVYTLTSLHILCNTSNPTTYTYVSKYNYIIVCQKTSLPCLICCTHQHYHCQWQSNSYCTYWSKFWQFRDTKHL